MTNVLKTTCILVILLTGMSIYAQELEKKIQLDQVEAHLRFLASDELMGRKTGEIGNWTAARYIAEQFRKVGAKPGDGQDYYQVIPFAMVTPPTKGTLQMLDFTFGIDDLLMIRLASLGELSGDVIYLPHAVNEEITDAVKGKLVLTNLGSESTNDPQTAFALTTEKKKRLREKGALGIVEIYQGRHPWNLIKRYLGSGSMIILDESEDIKFPSLVINDPLEEVIAALKKGDKVPFLLDTDGTQVTRKPSPNVIGIIEGTDPALKDEYVVLSAHFDHVGTSTSSDRPDTQKDSIFNGARDNAFGITALLSAAEILGSAPAKRSIMLLALTAEEIGLIGSKYFIENPTIPLNQIIFNLNTDGAGHSDSTIVAVMGLNRVGATEEITLACAAFGLQTFADPAPEQNLFDRSDNVSFATVGIPAPTFSPGFREFDNAIMKHYHQPSDEVETLDFNYVLRFCQAYTLAARKISDMEKRPQWVDDDKYMPAFRKLYGDR